LKKEEKMLYRSLEIHPRRNTVRPWCPT